VKLALSAFLTLALAVPAWGQVRATIDGPITVGVGSKVVLRSTTDAEKATFIWLSGSEDAAQIDYEEFGSSLAIWPKRPGAYGFTLVIIGKDAAGDTAIAKVRHRVEVTGVAPPVPPGPGPGPGPGPEPPTPIPPTPPAPSVYGLAEVARATAPVTDRDKVGANFRSVASQVGAGTLRDVTAMLVATRDANRLSVGDTTVPGHAWSPFFRAIEKRLDELKEAGRLNALSDYAAAWREIGTALQ
jgi:hypothetical protein